MNLTDAQEGKEYIIQQILTDDEVECPSLYGQHKKSTLVGKYQVLCGVAQRERRTPVFNWIRR